MEDLHSTDPKDLHSTDPTEETCGSAVGHVDYAGPIRQHGLNHTDHTDHTDHTRSEIDLP